MAESITITDNRNGESIEIPLVNGGVSAEEWAKLLPGVWFFDPGFMSTAACESAITYLDGEAGHPALPRLPDRAAGRELDLPRGGVPPLERRAAHRGRVRGLAPRDHVPHLHPRERPQAVPRGLPLRRPPDGDAGLRGGRPLDLLPRRQGHLRPRVAQQADHPADRQDADPGRGRPPLQRGHALRLPGQHARLRAELPLHDLEGGRAPLRGRPRARPCARRPLHPPRRPRAELLDHRHAGGRLVARRSLLGHRRRARPRSTARATAAPTRRSSGC